MSLVFAMGGFQYFGVLGADLIFAQTLSTVFIFILINRKNVKTQKNRELNTLYKNIKNSLDMTAVGLFN